MTSQSIDDIGDSTPVDASTWETATITDLYDQLSTLHRRRQILLELAKPEYLPAIEQSIQDLDAVIKRRTQGIDSGGRFLYSNGLD